MFSGIFPVVFSGVPVHSTAVFLLLSGGQEHLSGETSSGQGLSVEKLCGGAGSWNPSGFICDGDVVSDLLGMLQDLYACGNVAALKNCLGGV